MEVWRDVVNYEGYYQVSNLGNVRSVDRELVYKDGRVYSYSSRVLKLIIEKVGYSVVNLCNEDRSKLHKVHRLVAEVFISNSENKPCINHIDGNKQNNHISNLEWCTYKENMTHAIGNGLIDNKGAKHGRAKLTEEKVRTIRIKYANSLSSQTALAKEYRVSAAVIHYICNRKIWKHI